MCFFMASQRSAIAKAFFFFSSLYLFWRDTLQAFWLVNGSKRRSLLILLFQTHIQLCESLITQPF